MLTAVGCADNDIVEKTNEIGGDFTLEIDLGTESRAYYEKNGDEYRIFWNEGDKVYVSSEDGKSFGTLKLVDGSDTTRGTFTGSVIGQKKKLNYVVYPVPDKNGNIDLTTRSAEFQNPPMVATLGEDKTKASFEATVPAIQLKINNLPQGETLVVKAKGISGAGKVVKGDDGKFGLVYTTDSKNKITVTDLPGGDQTIYVPVITEGEEGEITTVNMTLSIGEAKYKKEVSFMKYRVTEVKEGEAKEDSNGFLQWTYIAAEEGRAAQLIEAWDTKADISWYNEENTEFAISKASELAGLAILVNGNNVDFEGKTVKLGASIDLDGELWTPVGKYAWKSEDRRYFKGTFDGQGYTISNLYANSEYAGLFGCVWGATIRNVVIEDAEVVGSGQAGAISAYVYGNANSAQATTTVENVTVTESTVNESENEPLFGVITSYAAVNVIEDGETTKYTSNSKLNALLAKGGEVTLDNDVVCNTEDPLVIPEGVSVTLNLNGKKIDNGVGVAIKNLGELTIEGSGVVNAEKDYAVYNEGTLVINEADVKGAGCINSDAGEVTIQSGVFKATDSWGNGTNGKVLEVKGTKLEIFDGTFNMSDVFKHNSIIGYGENSEVILHGGVFKANNNGNDFYSHIFEGYAVDGSSLKINGGTFVGAYRTSGSEAVHIIEINGGDFDLKSASYFQSKDIVTVKGGTYTTEVWKTYVAEGYSMVEEEGCYKVGMKVSVESNLD